MLCFVSALSMSARSSRRYRAGSSELLSARRTGTEPSIKVEAVPEEAAGSSCDVVDVRAQHKYSQLYRSGSYRRPGAVARAQARCASCVELPLEEELSEAESSKLDALRASVLSALQLEALPPDWRKSFLMRYRLVTYLRADRGDVKKATARVVACIDFCGEMWTKAFAWEAQPEALKNLYDEHMAWGAHGFDRRGCSVFCYRLGNVDVGGLVRESSFETYLLWDAYCTVTTYDMYTSEGERAGHAFTLGKVMIFDLSGVQVPRAMRGFRVAGRLTKTYPGAEHPFPEMMRTTFVINMPWVAQSLWDLAKKLLPARDAARFRMFGSGKAAHKKFLAAVSEYVDPEQLPALFGGGSAEPWAYGLGGDVPQNAAAGLLDDDARRSKRSSNRARQGVRAVTTAASTGGRIANSAGRTVLATGAGAAAGIAESSARLGAAAAEKAVASTPRIGPPRRKAPSARGSDESRSASAYGSNEPSEVLPPSKSDEAASLTGGDRTPQLDLLDSSEHGDA